MDAQTLTPAEAWRDCAALTACQHRFGDATIDHILDLEAATLAAAIPTPADAVAKLDAVALSFDRGQLGNGADVRALRDVINWTKKGAHVAPTPRRRSLDRVGIARRRDTAGKHPRLPRFHKVRARCGAWGTRKRAALNWALIASQWKRFETSR